MALQLFQLPLASSSSSIQPLSIFFRRHHHFQTVATLALHHHCRRIKRSGGGLVLVGKEDTELRVSSDQDDQQQEDPNPQDLESIHQIQRVLELLRKNKDMLFSEVKLMIEIEDLRAVERRRLLGIEYPVTSTRDNLAIALEEVNEGRVPKNRVALQLLAEKLSQWPNLEVNEGRVLKNRVALQMLAED